MQKITYGEMWNIEKHCELDRGVIDTLGNDRLAQDPMLYFLVSNLTKAKKDLEAALKAREEAVEE
jgi:hypothetical protein